MRSLMGKVFKREENDNSAGLILTIEKQIRGDGDVNLICGGCFTVLAEGMAKAWFASDVPLRCPNCQTWNAIPSPNDLE
jgi:hypothetical protein